jgi:hypothetical protein
MKILKTAKYKKLAEFDLEDNERRREDYFTNRRNKFLDTHDISQEIKQLIPILSKYKGGWNQKWTEFLLRDLIEKPENFLLPLSKYKKYEPGYNYKYYRNEACRDIRYAAEALKKWFYYIQEENRWSKTDEVKLKLKELKEAWQEVEFLGELIKNKSPKSEREFQKMKEESQIDTHAIPEGTSLRDLEPTLNNMFSPDTTVVKDMTQQVINTMRENNLGDNVSNAWSNLLQAIPRLSQLGPPVQEQIKQQSQQQIPSQ